MVHFYNAAYELRVAKQSNDAYYSLTNRLAAEIVLSSPSGARRPRSKAAKQRLDAVQSGGERIRTIAGATKQGKEYWIDTREGKLTPNRAVQHPHPRGRGAWVRASSSKCNRCHALRERSII